MNTISIFDIVKVVDKKRHILKGYGKPLIEKLLTIKEKFGIVDDNKSRRLPTKDEFRCVK